MEQRNNDGKAVASLVLGIISLVTIFTGTFAFIGIVLSVVGLILGLNSRKENPSGMATAGIVLSIISLVLTSLTVVACVACVGLFASLSSEYNY